MPSITRRTTPHRKGSWPCAARRARQVGEPIASIGIVRLDQDIASTSLVTRALGVTVSSMIRTTSSGAAAGSQMDPITIPALPSTVTM